MDYLIYRLKHTFPKVFRFLEKIAGYYTGLRYRRAVERATKAGRVEGFINGKAAVVRPLVVGDARALYDFLGAQSESRLKFFRPHDFSLEGLAVVLASPAYLNYGLFIGDNLEGYALLKLSPTGSAYRGRLVNEALSGSGVGKLLSQYLHWQAGILGVKARATISRHNTASLASLEAKGGFKVIKELPNDYLLIEFPPVSVDPPKIVLH
ncbi:hypothetical protein CAI21_06400 [Alkalilimnicola ehrlichii]|uniref:N-acetyltransferase domain-containing protein n=1 Tax=Alkalilimnicola ehrlichii TaxID=351052 RepID=A0A3E0X0X8_9GAMM|nr:GNAT family N-acetyltransferase [Alkalilimnicola ehrlichii]RFA30246.1 hypothetical protein CAI21_06400 [Alkalilimnicola ehrlichii]RFA37827.1 hypothetical protein CAL65_07750 [Alkalilimnicola ehrlichii]